MPICPAVLPGYPKPRPTAVCEPRERAKRVRRRKQKSCGESASDTRKQRFCQNCEASQSRCKTAYARQRGEALLGGTQDPITRQMPRCSWCFTTLFAYGAAQNIPRISRPLPCGRYRKAGYRASPDVRVSLSGRMLRFAFCRSRAPVKNLRFGHVRAGNGGFLFVLVIGNCSK